ncbi:MAG: histidine phosphatase family protein [bacterium]|nr:histidine phosphatase family protein [bacterium]
MSERTGETTVEIRRHSARHHDEWGHLTQPGVELARRVGATMGQFDLVVTSPLPRAVETAIAMGYGIDREIKDLAVVGETAMEQIDWPMGFASFVDRMKPGTALARRGTELADVLRSIAQDLQAGSAALAPSHGAVIEMAAIAATPSIDHASWGTHCGHSEGVRLIYQNSRLTVAEILRVDDATGR